MSAFDPKRTFARHFQYASLTRYDAAMRRRDFIVITGGMAGLPLAARAQQATTPVIGYINSRSPAESADIVAAFRQGLKEAGFADGENVAIESRFAAGNFAQLPDLAADLVRHRVNLIVATGDTVSVVKVKPVVPRTIPIVFAMGGDPVKLGVVTSLNRPGDNITGVAFLVNGLASNQIELLHELVPKAAVIGFLVNPKDPNAQPDIKDATAAADALGQKLVVGEASTDNELAAAFANFSQQHVMAVFVDAEPFSLISTRRSSHWQLRMRCQSFPSFVRSLRMGLWRPTGLALPKPIVSLVFMRVEF